MGRQNIRVRMAALRDMLRPLTKKQVACIDKQQDKKVDEKINREKSKAKFGIQSYYSLYAVLGDWQVERVFQAYTSCYDRRRERRHFPQSEVIQRWYNVVTGEYRLLRKQFQMWGTDFCRSTELNVKDPNPIYSYHRYLEDVQGDRICDGKLHANLKRAGLELKDLYGKDTRLLMMHLTDKKHPIYETLYKSNLKFVVGWEIIEKDKGLILTACKLALRNKIELDSGTFASFIDAVKLMNEFNVDWHNAKYLKDWRHQHDRCSEKKDALKKAEELKKLMLREPEFEEEHKGLLNVNFEQDGLFFRSLNTIEEYYDEGYHMHHCVFKMKYYEKPNTIIFSIRNEKNDRLATLEYNTKTSEVIQCYAACDKVPERYNDMIRVCKANVKKAIRLANKKVKQQIAIAV